MSIGVMSLTSKAESQFVKSLTSSLPPRIVSTIMPASESLKSSKTGDDLLTADLGKNDYDCLTPPGTPLVNPPDHERTPAYGDDILSHAVLPNLVRSLGAIKTSRLSSSKSEPIKNSSSLMALRPDLSLKTGCNGFHRSASSFGANSPLIKNNSQTNAANKRMPMGAPSSRLTSRPTTPTKRCTAPSALASRPTTPTSRSKAAPIMPFSRDSHPTTPTRSRATPMPVASRPSTPSNRSKIPSTSRKMDNVAIPSSLPARGSLPSRPTTPVRRPITSARPQTQPASSLTTRSSSVSKGRPVPPRSTPSSSGSSPTLKPNAWQQLSDIPGFSLEPPPNLRTSISALPTSNSRGTFMGFSRPSAPSSSSGSDTQLDRTSDPSTRRPSSPRLSRGQSGTGTLPLATGDSVNAASMGMMRNGAKFEKSRGDNIAVRGTNVVERMMQARRPFPSSCSPETALSMSQVRQVVKTAISVASNDGATNGRMTPRKSVDMPTRHMELCQGTTSNGLRTLVRSLPTSSLYSVRPAGMWVFPNKSLVATSRDLSSDYGMGGTVCDREGSEIGEELASEGDNRASPMSQPDSLSSMVKDAGTHSWTDSPEFKDDTPDSAHAIPSEEKPSSCETSPICRHGCITANCELCNMKIRLQKLNEKCRASLTASRMCSEEVSKGSIPNGNVFAPSHH